MNVGLDPPSVKHVAEGRELGLGLSAISHEQQLPGPRAMQGRSWLNFDQAVGMQIRHKRKHILLNGAQGGIKLALQ